MKILSSASDRSFVCRRVLSWLVVGVGLSLCAALTADRAGVQVDLDRQTSVLDSSGKVDIAEVQTAIDDQQLGDSIVSVRVLEELDMGELRSQLSSFVDACLEHNRINIFVSPDTRETEISAPQISSTTLDDILLSALSPKFAEGDFIGGLVAGIELLADEVASDQSPSGPDDEQKAVSSTAVTNQGDGGLGAGALVAGAGLLSAFGAIGGLLLLRARRHKLGEVREALSLAVADPISQTGAAQQRHAQLLKQVDIWKKLTRGSTLRELELHELAAGKASRDLQQQTTLVRRATPNGIGKATHDEAAKARGYLAGLAQAQERHRQELDRLLNLGARIDHLRVALPAKRQLLLEEVKETIENVSELKKAGWEIDDEELRLENIAVGLQTPDAADLAVDVLALHERQEKLEAVLFSTRHKLQSLPQRAESLLAWRSQLDESHDLELRRIDSADQRFTEVEQVHGSASWDWAKDHPEKALGQLESAMTLLRQVRIEGVSPADFDEVGRSLEVAGLEMLVADDLLDELDDLFVDLDRARIECPGILDQSRDVLASFRQFVTEHADEISPELVASPDEYEVSTQSLERELKLQRPNYLSVAQTGDRLNREIDRLLSQAKNEQQQTAAIRRQSDREVTRAQRSLQRARASLGWQLGNSADSVALDRLAQRLTNLPSEPPARLIAATRVADAAVAVRERIIARRRRLADWVIVSAGSGWSGGGWSSDSGWSDGGSSGGGSFGGGSFGGGSFGGGHSSQSW